ncbi:MAG: hypothetical protein KC646_17345 [Candidatus Cloacimonetes bacterium]|nr:hypothetical protein [Candidatus Cloacimonadota bacterium]
MSFDCQHTKQYKLLYLNSDTKPLLHVFLPTKHSTTHKYSLAASYSLTSGEQLQLDSEISYFLQKFSNQNAIYIDTIEARKKISNLSEGIYFKPVNTHYMMMGRKFFFDAFIKNRDQQTSDFSVAGFHRLMKQLGYLKAQVSHRINANTFKAIRRYKRAINQSTKSEYYPFEIKQLFVKLTTIDKENKKFDQQVEFLKKSPTIKLDLSDTLQVLDFNSLDEFEKQCFHQNPSISEKFSKKYILDFICRTKQLVHPIKFLRLAHFIGFSQVSKYDHVLEHRFWVPQIEVSALLSSNTTSTSHREGICVFVEDKDYSLCLRDESFLYNSNSHTPEKKISISYDVKE